MSINRRKIITLAGSVAAVASAANPGILLGQTNESSQPYSDRSVTDNWIVAWMELPHAATFELHLGRFADAMYFLRKPIGWAPNPGQPYKSIEVPVGFVTDFASIPRLFWSALPKDGKYTYPAIVHDFNYWVQNRQRTEADDILKLGMEDFNVGAVTTAAIYNGVRVGGGFAWDDNAAKKKSGEKRILKRFPPSPTITWEEWKKEKDVFQT